MRLEIRIHPEARREIGELPTSAHKREVMRMLLRAQRSIFGKPLGSNRSTGDLTGCRKVYFDESEDHAPGWRIVLRYHPDERDPAAVDVIAVGPREGLEAYSVAVRRLLDQG